MATAIPAFYLYGEPHRAVTDAFVHLEALDDRSRPGEWTIRPHLHTDLNHLFHLSEGGGWLRAEDRRLSFAAPCLLLVPAGIVHGFDWTAESRGSVLTLATSHLGSLARIDPDLGALFDAATTVALAPDEAAQAEAGLARLRQELAWVARAHRGAVDAALLGLLVLAARGRGEDGDGALPSRDAALVARFRARIEQGFRRRESIAVHARALGVGVTRLRAACAAVARQPPADMIDARVMLEAKRALLYSNLRTAEIAYALGFRDPAYFSRFFTRHAGRSPRAFRASAGAD
ncbi:MAG TPA: helix-turn-helix domain-containing protein [Sphingomonas sp.]|jgi:AraC family transcriptional activator of pobA|uniref:helix-turn-helix domain-containing protein n=1 Tax=Sphingomonas sp. TaxID=28214 RepID=UPI002ED9D716